MFLEDVLSWVENFATQEGPQLIQEGGKYAVGQSFKTTASSLLEMVQGIPAPPNSAQLPDGLFTLRVQRSVQDLTDQLQQLVDLASSTSYKITPEHPVPPIKTNAPAVQPRVAVQRRPAPPRRGRRRTP
jgi:hypothetical protein